jgi:hypothetical protein
MAITKSIRDAELKRAGNQGRREDSKSLASESEDDGFSEAATGDLSFDSAHITTPILDDRSPDVHTNSSWSHVSRPDATSESPPSPSRHRSKKPSNGPDVLGIMTADQFQSYLDMSDVSPSSSLHDRQTASSSTFNFRGKERASSQVLEHNTSHHYASTTEDDIFTSADVEATDDNTGDDRSFVSGPTTPPAPPAIDAAKSLVQSCQLESWPKKAINPTCRLPGEIMGVIGLILEASGYDGDLDRLAWACRDTKLDSGPSRLMIMPISQPLLEALVLPSRNFTIVRPRSISERLDAAFRNKPETTKLLHRCSSASYVVFSNLIVINAHDLACHPDGGRALERADRVIITTEFFDRIRRRALAGQKLDTAISKTANFIGKGLAKEFIMCISPPTVRPLPKDIPDHAQHINEELAVGAVTDAMGNVARMPPASWIIYHNIKAGDVANANFYGNSIVELAPDHAPATRRYDISIEAQKVLLNYTDWHLTLFTIARSISGLKPGMVIVIRYAHRLDPLRRKQSSSSYFRRRLVHSLFTYERPKLVSFDWDNATAEDAEKAIETAFWKTLKDTEAYVAFDKRVDEVVQFDDTPVHPPCHCCWVRPE